MYRPKEWLNQMHPYKRIRINAATVIIDEAIVEAVRKLNRLGVRTNFCCQGNHRAAEDLERGQSGAYISLAPRQRFPECFTTLARTAGLHVNTTIVYASNPTASRTPKQIRAANRRFVRVVQKWARKRKKEAR